MNVNSQKTNVCFGTNIIFVSPKDFSSVRTSFLLSAVSKNFIYNYDILKNCRTTKQCYRINSPKVCTTGIRTCIGINITNLKNKTSSLFAHFYHSNVNLNKMGLIKQYIKGNNAFIIGQRRDKYAFSSEISETLLDYCKYNNLPVTKMLGIRKGYEADMSYDGKTDSLFVCVSKINNKKKYVNNFERLKYVFKEICLAPCDNTLFLKEGAIKIRNSIFQTIYNIFLEKAFNTKTV